MGEGVVVRPDQTSHGLQLSSGCLWILLGGCPVGVGSRPSGMSSRAESVAFGDPAGRPRPVGDVAWRLHAGDLVVVDESTMTDTGCSGFACGRSPGRDPGVVPGCRWVERHSRTLGACEDAVRTKTGYESAVRSGWLVVERGALGGGAGWRVFGDDQQRQRFPGSAVLAPSVRARRPVAGWYRMSCAEIGVSRRSRHLVRSGRDFGSARRPLPVKDP